MKKRAPKPASVTAMVIDDFLDIFVSLLIAL